MAEAELQLIKEAIQLANDSIARLSDIKNSHVQHLVSMIDIAVRFGETLLQGDNNGR